MLRGLKTWNKKNKTKTKTNKQAKNTGKISKIANLQVNIGPILILIHSLSGEITDFRFLRH